MIGSTAALLSALIVASGLSGWDWEAKPTWLGNPAQRFSARWQGGRWLFEVDEAGKGMKWAAWAKGGPLFLEPGGYLVVEYRATNVAPGSDYALWVSPEPVAPNATALALHELRADGRWHTVAVDVAARGIAGPARRIGVHVQAARAPARLELRRLEFRTEAPAGATIIPAGRARANVKPWLDECSSAEGWRAEPSWLGNPDPKAKISARGGVLRIEVSQAGRGMKFSRRLV